MAQGVVLRVEGLLRAGRGCQGERSNPLLNSLNRLQVWLLGVRCDGNQHKLVKLTMQLTVNGIASALRNTG